MTPVMSTFMAVAAAAAPFSAPTTIDNPYLPLSKWKSCELRGRQDDGTRERNTLTRLKRTRAFSVDGQRVETLIIRDRAYEDGRLVEDTLDYFAQADDGTVHYFGEHVDNIRRGRVVDHHGSWLYGRAHGRAGSAHAGEPEARRPVAHRGRAAHHHRVEPAGGDRACARGRAESSTPT